MSLSKRSLEDSIDNYTNDDLRDQGYADSDICEMRASWSKYKRIRDFYSELCDGNYITLPFLHYDNGEFR